MKDEICARLREFRVDITNEGRLSACGDIQVANTARTQACQCLCVSLPGVTRLMSSTSSPPAVEGSATLDQCVSLILIGQLGDARHLRTLPAAAVHN